MKTYKVIKSNIHRKGLCAARNIKKDEKIMEIDWTLIVLIGILVCLVHMAISLADLRAGNRMDMDTLYKETATINKTIKDEIDGVKTVMRELG